MFIGIATMHSGVKPSVKSLKLDKDTKYDYQNYSNFSNKVVRSNRSDENITKLN